MAENEKLIEQRCCELLKARGMTFAAAESCTGGLIAKRITDVPGACARNHLNAHLLKVEESFCSDGFNLWYDNVRLVTLHHSGKCVAVQHVENLMFVGNLHCRCILILVACNDILSCTLGGDDKFLAQFART